MKIILVAVALLAFLTGPTPAARCGYTHRQHVRISGPGDNPRAWLWSSVASLKMFDEGQGSDYFIFFHTRLLENGTEAIVTAACPAGDRRIIGVHVLSGEHKGANGFVDATDAAYPP